MSSAPMLDLVLVVDPATGATRPVTLPGNGRADLVADRLAAKLGKAPESGWSLRQAGSPSALAPERTLLEAGLRDGDRIELVAQPAAPPPPPVAAPPPPAGGSTKGRAAAIVGACVAAVLLVAGGAFAATKLILDSDPTDAVSEAWETEPGDLLDEGYEEYEGYDEYGGDEGFEEGSEPGALEEGEGGATTSVSNLDREEMRSDIEGLLTEHHEAIVRGDYQQAWEYLSQRKRRQYLEEGDGYATWRKNQSTLAPHLEPEGLEVEVLSTNDREGVATVRVTGMGWSKPGADCTEWSGITWVKFERGDWYYDPGYSTTPSRERAWSSRYGKLLGASC